MPEFSTIPNIVFAFLTDARKRRSLKYAYRKILEISRLICEYMVIKICQNLMNIFYCIYE